MFLREHTYLTLRLKTMTRKDNTGYDINTREEEKNFKEETGGGLGDMILKPFLYRRGDEKNKEQGRPYWD